MNSLKPSRPQVWEIAIAVYRATTRESDERYAGVSIREEAVAGMDCTMQAQKIDVRQANSVRGQIQVTGVMIQGSKPIADFQLMFSLWRGSRMVELEIDVTKIDPSWSSREGYVAWRSAWPNESAVVSSWNQGVKQSFHSRKTASPLLIEIDEVEHRGYILAGGNAIHHRLGERFLDTVLGTMPASSVAGKLAFAIDLPRPYQAATEWLDPALVMEDLPQLLSCGQAAWFIQSNAANVSLVPWNAIVDANGQVIGMRAWLHESAGRSTASRIEFFRTPKAASRVSESGKSFSQVEIDGDSLVLSVKANEQSFIDILWS